MLPVFASQNVFACARPYARLRTLHAALKGRDLLTDWRPDYTSSWLRPIEDIEGSDRPGGHSDGLLYLVSLASGNLSLEDVRRPVSNAGRGFARPRNRQFVRIKIRGKCSWSDFVLIP